MRMLKVRPATGLGILAGACAVAVATTLALAGGVVTKGSGKSVSRVIARSSTENHAFTSATFEDLPGARATVKVPAGRQALVTARFTAQSTCTGSGGKGGPWCSVRIMIGGGEGHPAAGSSFKFDSSNAGAEGNFSWESHAMERFRTLGPGTHVVKVQALPMNAATGFTLGYWSLVVERSLK